MQSRFCARVSCGEPATAALFINARELVAQIVDITDEAGIDGVPLCRAHADAVIAPVGWTQEDLRSPFSPVEFEPELTLIDDVAPESPELPDVVPLPRMESIDGARLDGDDDLNDEAVGEVPPLLSRAFRAAGLD
ncbi:DUF3499 family protein [Candidatus Poriferisocius sp.]|uniref:DUF3499 family protein n=1 Tax=Candidatus Poriferisocius sp. TaxID=3101276 RepID=UPI003B59D35A